MTSITRINPAEIDKEAILRVSQAKFKLINYEPFWATLLMKMEVIWTKAVPTQGTDGIHLYVNPDFVMQCTMQENVGVALHEACHVAFGHHLRCGDRNPRKWNRAADYAINLIIGDSSNFSAALSSAKQGGGYNLPDGCLYDPKFRGLNAEQIYDLLADEPEDESQGPEDLFAYPGEGNEPGTTPSPADLAAGERKLKGDLVQAGEVAKKAGKGSIFGQRIVDEELKSEVDWKSLLSRFADAQFPTENSWSRPNRRFIGGGDYLPGMVKDDGLSILALFFDTSGSVGDEEYELYGAQVNAFRDMHPMKVICIYCDDAVQKVDIFEPGDPVKLSAVQGGGTDFRPPFAWLEENEITPRCAIYLTDLFGGFPEEPAYPVLWASITPDKFAPWGETIFIPFTGK